MRRRSVLAAVVLLAGGVSVAADGADGGVSKVVGRLERGEEVCVVAFGDSITGRYYHTGSRIAWPELLEQGLRGLYPKAKVKVVNAGISGNTTPAGLKRMDRDVLRHKPDLVVVMYGMNDVGSNRPKLFADNLRTIVKRSRDAGADVILCTQNNTYPAGPRRPHERLLQYTQVIRDVGAETKTPVADCRAAYEAVQKQDRMAWVMLMSETIHPNLNGHRVFAQTIIERLTGKRLTLDAFANSPTPIPRTLACVRSKRPAPKVTVVGMPAEPVAAALAEAFPKATCQVTARALDAPSVVALRKGATKLLKQAGEHLLVVALPAEPVALDFEAYKRHVFWVVRHSVSFGYSPKARDVVWVLPSVLTPDLAPSVQKREQQMQALAHSHDIGAIARPSGDKQTPAALIATWLKDQAKAGQPR